MEAGRQVERVVGQAVPPDFTRMPDIYDAVDNEYSHHGRDLWLSVLDPISHSRRT